MSARADSLDSWIESQSRVSWALLQRNISPEEPKISGGAAPLKGVVVAALSKKDPNYYFHWVRDAAEVMRAVLVSPYANEDQIEVLMRDYFEFSRRLQLTRTPFGMGDPRFQVDGSPDTVPWSRPQYDGPALRVLSALDYLERKPNGASRVIAKRILKTDLQYISRTWNKRGFDVWEELKAENYHTRLVQLAALERGSKYLKTTRYRGIITRLEAQLNDHWDPTRGFLRSQLAIEATDGYTSKKTDLDSAVIVAVLAADRKNVAHSIMDDRVQATTVVLEDLFNRLYPLNKKLNAPSFGRYEGDSYFGGNPWYFISADFARFHYKLAARLQSGEAFKVSAINLDFGRRLLPEAELQSGQVISKSDPLSEKLREALVKKGDLILSGLRSHISADGELYEQFDKNTGSPVSSPGIAWSHAAFLKLAQDRARSH